MQVDLIATCRLCGKPVDTATDCWRSSVMAADRVHTLCLAAAMVMDDAPPLTDQQIVELVNDAAEDICADMCDNPAHAGSPLGRN